MKRVYHLIICLHVCFVITSVHAATIIFNNPDIPFLGLEKIAKNVKKSVFMLQIEGNLSNQEEKDDYIPLGSGFLIMKNHIVFGITCAHVIDLGLKLSKPILVGLDTENGYQRIRCKIVKKDDKNDICIIAIEGSSMGNVNLQNLVLNQSYLANNQTIIEGRSVLIVGYPLGLGIVYNENYPVITIGIVAQYSGDKKFLIDGTINPGNSGSPVFDLFQKKFIGMVQSYQSDFIKIHDKKGKIVTRLPYNSGLGNAISSGFIAEMIKNLEIPK